MSFLSGGKAGVWLSWALTIGRWLGVTATARSSWTGSSTRPLDLIASREMTEVRAWLAQHPGIRVVARDRAGAYGQTAPQALTHAVQVTDRLHLLSNLSEMAERVLLGCQQALRKAKVTVTVNTNCGVPMSSSRRQRS